MVNFTTQCQQNDHYRAQRGLGVGSEAYSQASPQAPSPTPPSALFLPPNRRSLSPGILYEELFET
ncbi:hypothetical protein ABIB48_001793 [Arthrobacter sp. UYCu511]